ncbi:hypothetical protein GUJ93_ZPchr0011g27905 [Zizania palustris]|uniref:Secreted protein n=1 Tax=Zizania palustris TaxID=103762 RepID=A0A8J5WJF9_ZIZPA|nr:hypothetical protein GUJ93_ZPchr0011g27905 [Zizania palustris]
MDITEVTVVHHAALVLVALWAAVSAGGPTRRSSSPRSSTCSRDCQVVNYAIEKIWPVCMERVASEQFLLPYSHGSWKSSNHGQL